MSNRTGIMNEDVFTFAAIDDIEKGQEVHIPYKVFY
jgi:hypothetical protein